MVTNTKPDNEKEPNQILYLEFLLILVLVLVEFEEKIPEKHQKKNPCPTEKGRVFLVEFSEMLLLYLLNLRRVLQYFVQFLPIVRIESNKQQEHFSFWICGFLV